MATKIFSWTYYSQLCQLKLPTFPQYCGNMRKLVGSCITILVLLLGVSSEKHITAMLIYATIVLWEDWQVSDYGLTMNTYIISEHFSKEHIRAVLVYSI